MTDENDQTTYKLVQKAFRDMTTYPQKQLHELIEDLVSLADEVQEDMNDQTEVSTLHGYAHQAAEIARRMRIIADDLEQTADYREDICRICNGLGEDPRVQRPCESCRGTGGKPRSTHAELYQEAQYEAASEAFASGGMDAYNEAMGYGVVTGPPWEDE